MVRKFKMVIAACLVFGLAGCSTLTLEQLRGALKNRAEKADCGEPDVQIIIIERADSDE